MGDLTAFLRWCHPDLLEERLRHACACWQVVRALDLDPSRCPPPAGGSVSVIQTPAGALGISSVLLLRSDGARQRPQPFGLDPSRAPLWVLALLQDQPGEAIDPLDPGQWLFWVVPASRFHGDRRSISLQPLIRAHGEGLNWAGLQAAMKKPR